jgi:hypothetical protein
MAHVVGGPRRWLNREQQEVIECLKEENRILREKLGPGRIQLRSCCMCISLGFHTKKWTQ